MSISVLVLCITILDASALKTDGDVTGDVIGPELWARLWLWRAASLSERGCWRIGDIAFLPGTSDIAGIINNNKWQMQELREIEGAVHTRADQSHNDGTNDFSRRPFDN